MIPDNKLVEISFKGSAAKLEIAIESMLKLGFIQVGPSPPLLQQSELIPWREAFPEMNRIQENGIVLKEIRRLMGMTQKQLAHLAGIPQRHISEMETAKRPIGKETAKKFAHVLDVNYRLFL